jgi:DNA-binding NarL/FixJ family response regulator
MKPKVLLISWKAPEAARQAARFAKEGWDVIAESEDGGRAYKLAAEKKPHAIAVYMAYKAKHGIESAHAIHARKSTSDIPLVFVYQ